MTDFPILNNQKLKNMMIKEKFVIIGWSEIQDYMDREGFEENSHLINDGLGLQKYGSSAYFVNEGWLNDNIKI